MRFFRALVVMVGLFASWNILVGAADAQCSATSCTNEKVERLYLHENGLLYIRTTGDEVNLTCTAGNQGYLRINKDHAFFEEIYALLLSAQLSDKPVTLRLNNDSGTCFIVYAVIDATP